MQEINKDQKTEQSKKSLGKWCKLCSDEHNPHHCLKHKIVRWTLLTIILVMVFCLGVNVGKFSTESREHRNFQQYSRNQIMNSRNFGGRMGMIENRSKNSSFSQFRQMGNNSYGFAQPENQNNLSIQQNTQSQPSASAKTK